MSPLPPRPGTLPRLEFAIPCRRFENHEVSPTIEDVLEAAQLARPGRFQFQVAVKLFAPPGTHQLTVTVIDPKGKPQSDHRSSVDVTVEEPAWGERLAVPVSFPCDAMGWWTLEVALDGQRLGETHLWVQFAEQG